MDMATAGKLTMDCVVSLAADQVSSELAGEIVILNLAAGVYHGLEGTGARVWQLIQKPCKVSQVRDALLNEYDVEADRCERDLLELLEEFANNGLVRIEAAGIA